MQRIGDLEIDEDPGFTERGWKIQKAAWMLMLLFVMCALLGLTGSGPFARASVAADHFSLAYDRFDRMTTSSVLTIRFEPAVVESGTMRLWLKRDYLDSFQVESVVPEPESVISEADRLVYTFRALDNQSGQITFYLKGNAGSFGIIRSEVGIISGGQAGFQQFVYP